MDGSLFVALLILHGMMPSVKSSARGLEQSGVQGLGNVGCKAYLECYFIFHRQMGESFKDHCHIRDKLKVCKERVKEAFPRVELGCYTDIQVIEMSLDLFCTVKQGKRLFRDFYLCPFVKSYVPINDELFKPGVHMTHSRSLFAQQLLASASAEGYSDWKWLKPLRDLHDPVYRAVSTNLCAQLRACYDTFTYCDTYCGSYVDGLNIYKCAFYVDYQIKAFNMSLGEYECKLVEKQDPLEESIKVMELAQYLDSNINQKLPICHANNILVYGVSALAMFYARNPPFSDVHSLMPDLCKGLPSMLHSWKTIIEACPRPTAAMDNIMHIHNVICEIQADDKACALIENWASHVAQNGTCQIQIQLQNRKLLDMLVLDTVLELSSYQGFVRALECLLSSFSAYQNTSHVLSELYSRLEILKNDITGTSTPSGIEPALIDYNFRAVLKLLIRHVHDFLNFFLITNNFVNYDPVVYPLD